MCPSSHHQEGNCASVVWHSGCGQADPHPTQARADRVKVEGMEATLRVQENCTKELYFGMIGSGCAQVWPPAVSVAWEVLGRCGGVLWV